VSPATQAKTGGPTITLHVDHLDVQKALEMICREAKVNILVSPKIVGSVTLDIREKNLEEALESIAKLCHGEVKREAGAYYISTSEELRKAEEDNLPVRIYRLNYVRSGDVIKLIKPLLSKKGIITQSPDSETGISSDISTVDKGGSSGSTKEVKAGGNSWSGDEILVVQDYEQILKNIDRMIAEFDVQPIQVLIEAVIVQVTLNKNMEFGINFGALDGAGNVLGTFGNGSVINGATGFFPASVLAASAAANSVTNGTNNTASNANTGNTFNNTTTSGSAISSTGKLSPGFGEDTNGLKVGWTHSNTTGFIKALEGAGEVKVLATPRIMVLNKQRAEIHLGKNMGYQDQTTTQTSTSSVTNFLKIGTQLRLRPYVTPDGMIRMEVHPERSDGVLENGIPQTTVQQVTTNVQVPDGKTIVIGGLLSEVVEQDWEGLPLVSRLPYIGFLFRHNFETTKKEELVIILTPHICRPAAPEELNYLGRPSTLGLDKRVGQRARAEAKDGASLFELTTPPDCPRVESMPLAPPDSTSRRDPAVTNR
jgi:general secretion pathway protein D